MGVGSSDFNAAPSAVNSASSEAAPPVDWRPIWCLGASLVFGSWFFGVSAEVSPPLVTPAEAVSRVGTRELRRGGVQRFLTRTPTTKLSATSRTSAQYVAMVCAPEESMTHPSELVEASTSGAPASAPDFFRHSPALQTRVAAVLKSSFSAISF